MNDNIDKNIFECAFYFHFFKMGREGVLVKSKYNVEDEMLKIGLKLRPPCKNSNIKYFFKNISTTKNNFKLTILLFPTTTTTTIIISTNIITIDYTYIKKNKEKSGD